MEEVIDPLDQTDEDVREKVRINSARCTPEVPGVYEVYYYYTGLSGETVTAILTVVAE